MTLGLNLLKESFIPEQKEKDSKVEETQTLSSDFNSLRSFLTSVDAIKNPNVFSSENSLKAVYSYGDIYDNIRTVKLALEGLMMDNRLDFDNITKSRDITFLRNVFISKEGDFPDVMETVSALKKETIKLIDGYVLRKQCVHLGIYTLYNLPTVEFILLDLDSFFSELFDDYRNNYSRHNTVDVRG